MLSTLIDIVSVQRFSILALIYIGRIAHLIALFVKITFEVYAITSASMNRSREFDTPLGHFSFTRIPQKVFYTEVTRIEKEVDSKSEPGFYSGESYLTASPMKALADYIYTHRLDWVSINPVIDSLRVEEIMFRQTEPGASSDCRNESRTLTGSKPVRMCAGS